MTGWGSTNKVEVTNKLPSPILQMAKIRTMNDTACADSRTVRELQALTKEYILDKIITGNLCAFDAEQSPCYYDSGGNIIFGGLNLKIKSSNMMFTNK